MSHARLVHGVLLVCSALCTSTWTSAQGGGSPAANPAIAFVELGGSSTRLSVMNADGARKTTIYTTPGTLLAPCWSPSGSSICFGLQIAGAAGLAVLDVQVVSGAVVASNFRLLVSGDWTRAAWAPDGATIAFSNGLWPGIWSIPATGGTPTRLYHSPAVSNWLAWSPDGAFLAFSTSTFPQGELRVLDTTDGSDVLVCAMSGGINQVDWARTGNALVFHATAAAGNGKYIYRVDAAANATPTLLVTGAWFPTWSPDDAKIAYTTGSNDSIVIRTLQNGSVSSTGAKGRFANWRR